jgi:thymidylate kinase
MTLIVFESIDGTGKSTTIKKLVDKYPHIFGSFAFPTTTSYFYDQGQSLKKDGPYKYHFQFEIDFLLHQEHLEQLQKKKTLLLDRYFISNLIYSEINTDGSHNNDIYIPAVLSKIEHLVPDLVILLLQYNPADFENEGTYTVEQLQTMQYYYLNKVRELKEAGKIKDYKPIYILYKGEDRLSKVEDVLRVNGFL